MQELSFLRDDEIISNGSIIRLYEVGRFDIMKTLLDRNNSEKKEMDFYEYMIVNISLIESHIFSLVNVTKNNSNRGSILCEFDTGVTNPLVASHLKNYFGNTATVFVELNR
jgi:hypothetical protein